MRALTLTPNERPFRKSDRITAEFGELRGDAAEIFRHSPHIHRSSKGFHSVMTRPPWCSANHHATTPGSSNSGAGSGVRIIVSFSKRAWPSISGSHPIRYQVRLHRRRAKTSPRDNRQPRTFFGSVPCSKRRRPPILRKQTIGPAFHREEPKTLGADRRLSWSLGVDFPVATLNATSESLRRCWDLRVAKSKPIRYCVATDAAHFSSTATRFLACGCG